MRATIVSLALAITLSQPAAAQPSTGLICLYAISVSIYSWSGKCTPERAPERSALNSLLDDFRQHVKDVDNWTEDRIKNFEQQMGGGQQDLVCQLEDTRQLSNSLLDNLEDLRGSAEPLLASREPSTWGVCL